MSSLKRNKKDPYDCFYKLTVKHTVLHTSNSKLKKKSTVINHFYICKNLLKHAISC